MLEVIDSNKNFGFTPVSCTVHTELCIYRLERHREWGDDKQTGSQKLKNPVFPGCLATTNQLLLRLFVVCVDDNRTVDMLDRFYG